MVLQGMVSTRVKWEFKHYSIAYSLTNICIKNYWYRTMIVKIIIDG